MMRGMAEETKKSKEIVVDQNNNCALDCGRPIRTQIATPYGFVAGRQEEINKPTGRRLESYRPVGMQVQ